MDYNSSAVFTTESAAEREKSLIAALISYNEKSCYINSLSRSEQYMLPCNELK